MNLAKDRGTESISAFFEVRIELAVLMIDHDGHNHRNESEPAAKSSSRKSRGRRSDPVSRYLSFLERQCRPPEDGSAGFGSDD